MASKVLALLNRPRIPLAKGKCQISHQINLTHFHLINVQTAFSFFAVLQCSSGSSGLVNPPHLSLRCEAVMGLSQSRVYREMGRGSQSISPCPPCLSSTYLSFFFFFFHASISESKERRLGHIDTGTTDSLCIPPCPVLGGPC